MSAQAFFRLKCDGGCDRWLSDVVGDNVPKLTTVRSRALVFLDEAEAVDQSVTVGWTKCPDLHPGTETCELHLARPLSLCGTCRAKKEKREQS